MSKQSSGYINRVTGSKVAMQGECLAQERLTTVILPGVLSAAWDLNQSHLLSIAAPASK